MDTRRIENIIIAILVLLNVFLLAIVISDRAQARRSERETAETAAELLAANGIDVREDVIFVQETPACCTVLRDFDREAEQMEALIGANGMEDLGGSIRFYRSERGQAVLRGTGEMDLLLTGGSVPVKGSPEKTAQRFFADAEIAGSFRRSSASDESVECCCLWNGLPVYNARLTFDFSGDNLFMVTGTMPFTKEAERSTAGVMDAISVLMRFAEIVRSEGFICSRLDALTPGYLMSVTVSGECTLTPVWHIETDTGELYVNALNGKTEMVG